jgi:hypothetical protein
VKHEHIAPPKFLPTGSNIEHYTNQHKQFLKFSNVRSTRFCVFRGPALRAVASEAVMDMTAQVRDGAGLPACASSFNSQPPKIALRLTHILTLLLFRLFFLSSLPPRISSATHLIRHASHPPRISSATHLIRHASHPPRVTKPSRCISNPTFSL